MKKSLLSIAIIAVLPMAAMADYTYVISTTPARVVGDGTVTVASHNAPYVTATINDDDDEHIASTAYVKGAYNDTIAAVNSLNESKQTKLTYNGRDISEYLRAPEEVSNMILTYPYETAEQTVSYGYELATIGGVAKGVNELLNYKRVTIYTTWDDDSANATTQVELSSALN